MIVRVACLFLLFAATPALAQEPDGPISIPGGGPREPPPPPGPPPLQLFISPAGEPFRAEPDTPYPVAAWFSRADADHDGQLTRAEFTADALGFFDQLDSDRNQIVDGFENARYEREVAPEILGIMPAPNSGPKGPWFSVRPRGGGQRGAEPESAPLPRQRGAPPPARRQGAAQYALLNEPHPVRGADADLDQRVSRLEAETAARRRFALLDQDGDRHLLLADLPRTAAQVAFEPPPEGDRRRKPPKRVEMRRQPPAAIAIETALPRARFLQETP